MTTVTTAPEAEYWLQTGWMEEPGAELGIRKPITIDRKTNLHEHRAYWCVRRAQDIFFSLLALVVLSPLMLLTCIAVWIDSPGASPVFSQLRVGRNGKLFRLYKFRSMCPNAESKLNDLLQDNEMDGPVFKMKDDPRITRVGHFPQDQHRRAASAGEHPHGRYEHRGPAPGSAPRGSPVHAL